MRKVVAAMGYLFYETGGVEAGVDGFIEIRDPETGAVANQTIQFQSKATTKKLPGDSHKGFHWNCSDKDIGYWSFGTMPMILIVVDIENDTAYWKDLRSWFAKDENRAKKRFSSTKPLISSPPMPHLPSGPFRRTGGLGPITPRLASRST